MEVGSGAGGGSSMMNGVYRYFTDRSPSHRLQKSLDQASDSLILGVGKFSRGWLLVAAFCIQMCLGSKYAWSVYVSILTSTLNVEKEKVAITLSIMVAFVGLANVLAGPVIMRHGPRIPAVVGCTMFMMGHLIAALACSIKSLVLLYIGYGVVAGTGVGVTFLCPIFTLQLYFPERRGMASGFGVAGYGAGIGIGSLLANALLSKFSVVWTLSILAAVYATIQIPCALILRFPPRQQPRQQQSPSTTACTIISTSTSTFTAASNNNNNNGGGGGHQLNSKVRKANDASSAKHSNDCHSYTGPEHAQFAQVGSIVRHPLFWLAYLTFMMHQVAGLFVFPRVANVLEKMLNVRYGIEWYVAAFGIFNAGGRLVMSALCDHTRPSLLIVVTTIGQLLSLIGLHTSVQNQWVIGFCMCAWMLIFFYGSGFGMLAVLLIELFGPTWLGTVLGITLSAFSLDGLLTSFIFRPFIIEPKPQQPLTKPDYTGAYYLLYGIIILTLILATSTATVASMRRRRHNHILE